MHQEPKLTSTNVWFYLNNNVKPKIFTSQEEEEKQGNMCLFCLKSDKLLNYYYGISFALFEGVTSQNVWYILWI